MKLSVVIPVYRVESTLLRCVSSVLQQSVADMEIILIDDGSPDSCPVLCDYLASLYNSIKVIHKENGGLSDARNVGIDISRGEYITFIDSDDYIDADTYPALLDWLDSNPGCDIVEYSVADRLPLNDHTWTDIDRYWIETRAYSHTYAWNKIYRRRLFSTDIRFPVGKVFEDVYTYPLLLKRAKSVATSSKGIYHYSLNPDGITATAGGAELQQLLEAHLGSNMPIDDHYYMYLVNIQIDVCERLGIAPQLPLRRIDISHLKCKEKIKAILLKLLGINILCKIIIQFHKVRKPSRL